MSPDHDPKDTLARILAAEHEFPALAERIERALLIALHQRGIATVDDIHARAREKAEAPPAEEEEEVDDNVALITRLGLAESLAVSEITVELASERLTPADIDDIVNLQRKREEARSLGEIANLSRLSFGLLAEKVRAFGELPRGQTRLPESEVMGVRVALIRNFISDQLEFIGVARRYLTIRDFDRLLGKTIGNDEDMGRIGGKAAGLLLASCILRRAAEEDPDAPDFEIHTPESWYLRSDVFERFLEHQHLVEFQSQKYKDPEQIEAEYPLIVKVFKNADFPPDVVEQLRWVVVESEGAPLIVRSSSLLEDRFGVAFAGKYRSIFIANQGTEEERLDELLGAIAEVYASTLHPDAISYRVRHNLVDFSEDMAVLIQRVVGRRHGRYFLPTWAGVAFSRNEYRRNPRLRVEDGIARLVFGLGTRAVDRVSSDFPRMVPLGAPTLRAETNDNDIARNSQRRVDVVNLERGRFETVDFRRLISDAPIPGIEEVVSFFENGHLRRPVSNFINADPRDLVITFERWTSDTRRPREMRWILSTLEKAYGGPVDIEWASDGERFYLLQCRPQAVRGESVRVDLPEGISEDRQLFTAAKDVTNASVDGVEYVVCVNAAAYDALESPTEKRRVGRVIHCLNRHLADRTFILMGPGRWGTKDPGMGVRVGYGDIHNTRMLIEVARPLGGFVPEASFGSHFFQDLIESEIEYLALYPEEDGVLYRADFFLDSPSVLTDLLPEHAEFESVVRVIDVPAVTGGLHLRVAMDGESGQALGYLTE